MGDLSPRVRQLSPPDADAGDLSLLLFLHYGPFLGDGPSDEKQALFLEQSRPNAEPVSLFGDPAGRRRGLDLVRLLGMTDWCLSSGAGAFVHSGIMRCGNYRAHS